MTPEQREAFCERYEVTIGPVLSETGMRIGWHAHATQQMYAAYAVNRSDAIETLAKMMGVMK